jgi:nicotinate-nucleotide adenylyltransferase
MKAVAIFGGTFNPIHFGHLCIAEEIRTKFNLDKVIFVPTNLPPHKNPSDLVSARQRWLMTHLATVSNPCFEVSTFEIDSGGKSYAVDTIKHFRKHFGDKVKIYFIIGADMLVDIAAWKNIGEILKLCRFIAVSRPGYDVQKIFNQYYLSSKNTSIASELMENVLVEDVDTLDISSTSIRQRVKEWKSIKYLVPETVEQFIHNQQLYL